MSLVAAFLAFTGTAEAYHQIDAKFTFRKNIDPIVVPGQYVSHMHSFFGSDAVTANTTTSAEVQTGCNTNTNPNDLSVYWTPTLYAVVGDERIPIEPNSFKAYYNNIGDADITFPQDFKVVAGNALATSQADVDPKSTMSWWCEYGPEGGPKDEAAFPTQSCVKGRLQTILRFQDCINPDSHEAVYSSNQYGTSNWCPKGMKRIPQLRFSVRYDTSKALPNGWTGKAPLELASGSSYSFHGDFINGWLPEAAENLLAATDKREWQPVSGPLSRTASCSPTDPDPENGTDDWAKSVAFINSGSSASGSYGSEIVEIKTPEAGASITEEIKAPAPLSGPECYKSKLKARKSKRRHMRA
ncbi:hypothetical protein CCHL11_07224 [Colletotrichum chlorophyti]|uniref:DUF1996 domain-containing protein n=1 Tax=Colletotrichum chlorophyti TaxID=708187 RepID=A0A1Q8RX89_9PEZI|nr:hypothetical protein CCHL11_07224 [Colletotrichum chlorophyti]